MTRQSTDIPAVEDPEVAASVRFIRENNKKAIAVSDLENVITISRRSLEHRFRKTLGRSVLDEIKRVRTDQIGKMLVETNMSVLQIALALEFPSIENIPRYFRQEKGFTPIAYRRKYTR